MVANIATLDSGQVRFLALTPETKGDTFNRTVTHPITKLPMAVRVWWESAAHAAGMYTSEITAADIARTLDQQLVKAQNVALLDSDGFYDRLLEAADIIRGNAANGLDTDHDMLRQMLGIMPVDSYSWIGTDPSSGRQYAVHSKAGEGHTNFSAERFAWFVEELRGIYGGRVMAVGALGQVPTVAFASIGVPQIEASRAWRGLGVKPFLIVADGYASNRRFGVTATTQVTHCQNTLPARGMANVAISHTARGEINMAIALADMERALHSLDAEYDNLVRMANTKTTIAKLLDGDKDVTIVDPRDGKRKPFPGLAPILKGDAAKKKGAEAVRDRLRESLQWTLDNMVNRTHTGKNVSAFDTWMVGDSYDQWVRPTRERGGYKAPLSERQGMDLLTGTGGDMGDLARAYADALIGAAN